LKSIKPAVLLLLILLAMAGLPHGMHAASPPEDNQLQVVTKPLEPFVLQREGKLTGFSVELWEALARDRGWNYEWIIVDTVTQQMDMVVNGKADLAIAGISMTPEREKIVDFSHPYFNSGLQIITSEEGSFSLPSLWMAVFSPTLFSVLGIGLLILIIIAHIIWLVERRDNNAMPKGYLPGIWEASWWSLSTVATSEYGNKERPRTNFKRVLAMLMVILGIILIAQFTAAITASLTVQQLTGSIHGPADLPGKRIAVVQGSTSMKYLDDENISYVPVARVDEAYKLLESGRVQAVVYDAPVLQYYAHTAGKGRVQLAGPVFEDESYGIALPTGSKLRKPLNESLLRLQQNGVYSAIYERWFGDTE
jgi:polar amino acid transport system substrate-binding protein